MGFAPTPSQTVGPFFSFALLDGRLGPELVQRDSPGAIRIRGQLLDGAGEPVRDGMIELWQPGAGFGRSGTEDGGWFELVTVKPEAVGLQAPHIEVGVFARGLLKRLATRVYFPDEEEANAADPLLSALEPEARETLIAGEEDGALRFDIRIQGDRQTVFFVL